VDADWLRLSELSDENLAIDVRPENLAYVIYTSGSAGQPKGLEVVHRGVVRLVKENDYAHLGPDETCLQFAPLAFDASTFEIWGMLLNGGRLVIMPPGPSTLSELGQALKIHHVTVLWLTAGLFNLMVDEQLDALRGLRQLLAGGDALSVSHVERFLREAPECKLINGYGPTENTTFTCCYPMNAAVRFGHSVPIGRPIANTQVYILDKNLEPVAPGVSGELYTGGDGLARGYLKRPELTSDRFIPNPFSLSPGARLYKTGDLAAWLPDGNIEFRGRIDQQIKLRGFRIELGEIEAALAEHPLVRESVVEAKEDEHGEKRLVAYIVSEQGQTVEVSELRGYLIERLPDYMVPAAFVILDELPLTPNGKIDRRALQVQDETALTQHQAYVAPRDSVELQLVQIWEDLIGTPPIGVTDNFFELGGHSLIAVRLMNRIEDRFQRALPLATLFQRATIEQLAEILREQQGTTPQSPLVEIRSGSAKPLFCVHAIGGTVLGYHKLAHLLSPSQAFYGLQARGLHAGEEPHTRIEDMAADYIEALRVVQPQGPYLLAGHSMGGIIAFEMSQQLQQQGQEVALLALIDSWAPVHIPEADDAMLLAHFAQERGLPITVDEILQRHPDEQLTYLVEQAQMAHVLPPGVGIEQARRLLCLYKNNARAIRSYVPQLNQCRLTFFRASEHLTETRDPASGWSSLTVQEMEIYDVPGDHLNMIREPHVRILAERLQNYIDQTSRE
jgi:aspartate racemase